MVKRNHKMNGQEKPHPNRTSSNDLPSRRSQYIKYQLWTRTDDAQQLKAKKNEHLRFIGSIHAHGSKVHLEALPQPDHFKEKWHRRWDTATTGRQLYRKMQRP